MTRSSSSSAEHLLQRTREQILAVLAGVVLAFIGLMFVLGMQVGQQPQRLLGAVGVLSALILILGYWGVFRHRKVNIGLCVLLIALELYAGHQILQRGETPISFVPWLLLVSLITFVTVGTTVASVLTLLLTGGMFGLLLVFPPSPQLTLAWVTGLVTFAGISLISYLLVRFIEQNTTLHAETSDRLRAARLDALTGVYGRAATEEELRRSIEHAQKTHTALSILVTDIDHFKHVNDRHGHATGDDVLRAFAKRLRRNVGGAGGIVGRWGGEEFLIILPGMARPDAYAIAERLRLEVSNSLLAGMPITASFGLASYRSQDDNVEKLFARADERLYVAKNAGRNLVK